MLPRHGMGKIIGIDLGTTNSCVSVLEGTNAAGQPEVKVIANGEGARTTPSVVGFSAKGERLVGQVANAKRPPTQRTPVYAVKRLMGQKFSLRPPSSARRTPSHTGSSSTRMATPGY